MAVKVAVIAVAIAALIADWMVTGDMGVMEALIAIMIATPVDGDVICGYDGSADGWVVVAVVVGGVPSSSSPPCGSWADGLASSLGVGSHLARSNCPLPC